MSAESPSPRRDGSGVHRRHREIIDLLLSKGLITEEQLQQARLESRRTGLNIQRALEKLGAITEEDVVRARAEALGLPYMDLSDYAIDTDLVRLIPEEVVKKYRLAPLFRIGESLTVGMVEPQDIEAIDHLRRLTGIELIEPVMVSDRGVDRVLEAFYGGSGTIDDLLAAIDRDALARPGTKQPDTVAAEAPIVRLVDAIIVQALRERVSDIHIEPEADHVRVRCRIDGLLRETATLPKDLQNAVTSRIKIMAKMDIAESRKPQDGRIRMQAEDRDLDLRVSTFPTVHGENVVMRLLDKSSVLLGLKQLGFLDEDLEVFDRLIRHPNGIILVTGPTGSGKTSTLYAALTTINGIEKSIVTIEDPVEYELPLIRQTQVNPKAGITFATGLRGILRQDPDVIMVGEIRDKETADVAVQAALTGHLVLATLHTNDAPSALSRLTEMGIEPFLIAGSVVGIIAQRLVRLVCPKCKEAFPPDSETVKTLGLAPEDRLHRGSGCGHCQETGYKGRMGIFEILVVNRRIRELVEARASADEIKKTAVESGMRTLREDGLVKVRRGLTTLEEVLRVSEVEF